jgi:cytochrome b561
LSKAIESAALRCAPSFYFGVGIHGLIQIISHQGASLIVVNLRQSLAFISQVRFESPSVNVHRGLAAITVLVGVVSQLCDSLVDSTGNTISKLHVLFGLALFSAILARFLWELRRKYPSPAIDIHTFNRQLKRQVYLLLYGLAGMKELVNISVYIWRGGAFVAGGVHIGNDAIVLAPFDDFKIYAAYGVASVFLIRALLTICGPQLTLRRWERCGRNRPLTSWS